MNKKEINYNIYIVERGLKNEFKITKADRK